MAVRLELRRATSIPIEVPKLVETALAAAALAEIERFLVQHGNAPETVGDLFRVSGSPGGGRIEFLGDCSSVHRIGEAMTTGSVRIDGHAGRHVGAAMRGGEIEVRGDASDWLGAEMRGGRIRVQGNAGRSAGAAYVGSPVGMRGGEILITGDAGDEAGHTMRRGLIAVGGRVGAYAGIDMIAGTVLAFRGCGVRPAAGMRRGTIAVFADAPEPLPTFRAEGICQPTFLRIYLRHAQRAGMEIDPRWLDDPYLLISGDHLDGGRGEILVRQSTA
ncbi:MAG TPA: formylmethanofuran dehydrogenase subunit C [Pirellulales bacterium]|jgi:formylmethanofuran dehydrogenase subunit C|nr:formylmethanofuran dehydrogenase subunit C [Pirellulales bacterium]